MASPPDSAARTPAVRVSEVLGALTFALDLTEGQAFGHSLRACLIGMGLGDRLGLALSDRRDLYYALLLKDAGCSGNAARVYQLFGGDDRSIKHDLKRVDWSSYLQAAGFTMAHAMPGSPWIVRARHIAMIAQAGPGAATELVRARCERGGSIARELGFGDMVARAIESLDEHWDGRGKPRGLHGTEIPVLSRIMGLAQTLEVFASLDGVDAALGIARERRGRWFDPLLVDAADTLAQEIQGWCALEESDLQAAVRATEPGDAALLAGPGAIDRIATAFAGVVDAKSPFTAEHSTRVAAVSKELGSRLGLPAAELADLGRAALLHDLGKLSVPNCILDKPGPLSEQEWEIMRLHPYFTQRVLDRVGGLERLALVASAHHERLDGRGYFRGLSGDQLMTGARILAVADVYDALTSERPYRPGLGPETALHMMQKDRGIGLDGAVLDALKAMVQSDVVAPVEERMSRAA